MASINIANIRRMDLNLLLVFQCLMNERSVTKAANALFLTQGAVSASLRKLRLAFNDELFTRGSHGMTPTHRALEIAPQISEALKSISALVTSEQDFDPARSSRVFRIALSDDLETMLAKRMIRMADEQGWTISFSFYQTNSYLWPQSMVEHGADLVICSSPKFLSAMHKSQVLFSASYICVYDKQSSCFSTPISKQEYLHAQHGRVSFDGLRGFVDELFDAERMQRKVKASFTHFSGAINAVIDTPLVLTMPDYAAHSFAECNSRLAVSPVPLRVPSFIVSMIWDINKEHDEESRWLRRFVLELTEQINGRSGQGASPEGVLFR